MLDACFRARNWVHRLRPWFTKLLASCNPAITRLSGRYCAVTAGICVTKPAVSVWSCCKAAAQQSATAAEGGEVSCTKPPEASLESAEPSAMEASAGGLEALATPPGSAAAAAVLVSGVGALAAV